MTISLIACCDLNNSIGYKGSLLTKPPLDFKYFRALTEGNFVVFGKDSFMEIGKPLSKRHNIVLSRNPKIDLPNGVYHYLSVEDILFEYDNYSDKSVKMFICGGQKVYQEFLPFADYIHLTIVNHSFEKADRHFPKFSLDEWKPTENVENKADDKYPYSYNFVTYERKNNIK
ncbi:dihydrofolate reductase [Neobacillus vireti]|uniref:dihydrofolate reductase n=1 Tax=Neobacillus vireti TaxID=220686 RepID=UPI002FFD7324